MSQTPGLCLPDGRDFALRLERVSAPRLSATFEGHRRLEFGMALLRRWLRDHYGLQAQTIDDLDVAFDGPKRNIYCRTWWFSVPSENYPEELQTGYLKLLARPWGNVHWHIEGLY